jgi:FkbM family methyltransferase
MKAKDAIKRLGKRFVRRVLKAQGYQIIRRSADDYGPQIPLLSLLIEHCALIEGKGAILQVGANDGIMDDPVREVILALTLPAILVEPLPDKFERLRCNYSNQPNIRFENVAVSTESGQAKIFRISAAAKHLPEWTQGFASFDKSLLLKHFDDPGGEKVVPFIESVRVPVVTIRQLLERHPDIGRLIALQIDAEGHDFAVVKSAVEAGCLPRIINYEHKHLTYSDQAKCRDLLSSHGYSFCAAGQDTLAYRMPIP